MCDLGASINVMPLSIYSSLNAGPLKENGVIIQLADRSIVYPKGVLEDVLVQVNGLIFPADFFILDMEGDKSSNSSDILLGRPFLSTARTKIDVHNGTLTMEFDGEVITFNVYDTMKYPNDVSCVSSIDIVEPLIQTAFEMDTADKLMVALCKSLTPDNIDDVNQETSHNELHEVVYELESSKPMVSTTPCKELHISNDAPLPYILRTTKLDLKSLPDHLKYVFLGEGDTLPIIISNKLNKEEERKLLEVLIEHKEGRGWTIADIKGIGPSTACIGSFRR
ncbi:hypothetical protein K2173_000374 [Erythroxylum novogranatense]|uniref:Reverse transcriptase domain-containing protein n=1 Tax=Erythroxylum novogranatense TaxID=1862640 RepID=A0AAV8SWE3_9ROSI|nr:hypothetical protein K2173_000374 [Erythroxylum novogranatense]